MSQSFGGLGMGDPTAFCESQFDASLRITAPLKDLIISQVAHAHPPDTRSIKAHAGYDYDYDYILGRDSTADN